MITDNDKYKHMKINEILQERSQAERKRDAGVKHDQFFTRPEIAASFAGWVKAQPFYSSVTKMIEPAAGARALSRHFPGIEEYDLDPQYDSTTQQDFLSSNHAHQPGTMTVMNPPFGKGSGLAVEFFNKAAEYSDYIAGIFPRSFRRGGIQNRLNRHFHLVDEKVLPAGAFFLPSEGELKKYDVPAVAQIWSRENTERETEKKGPSSSSHFQFTSASNADLAFRRKGRSAGEIVTDNIENTNPNSFYYISGDDRVQSVFRQIDWSKFGQDAIGSRYITKAEIIQAVNAAL